MSDKQMRIIHKLYSSKAIISVYDMNKNERKHNLIMRVMIYSSSIFAIARAVCSAD